MKPPVEERIVDRFTIGQQDDPKEAVVHLRNGCPSANTTIPLNEFAHGRRDGRFDPFVADDGSVSARTNSGEIGGDLQLARLRCGLTKQGNRRAATAARRVEDTYRRVPVDRRVRHQHVCRPTLEDCRRDQTFGRSPHHCQ